MKKRASAASAAALFILSAAASAGSHVPPAEPPLYPTTSTAPIVFARPLEGRQMQVSSEWVIGRVIDPLAHFEINGQTVTVHPKGGFIAWLPVSPGTFTFHAELFLASGPVVADLHVFNAAPPPAVSTSGLAIDPTSLAPKNDLELRAGDWWTIRMRATPGKRARARVVGGSWRDLRESSSGVYEAIFQIAPGEQFGPAPLEYEIGSGWSTKRLEGSSRVRATFGPPAIATVKFSTANPTVKIGPNEGFLAFPPGGTRFLATGRDGNLVRVAYGANLSGWIDAKDVELSTTAAPPRAVTEDIGVTTSSSDAVVRIPLGDRVPFIVDEDSEPLDADFAPLLDAGTFELGQLRRPQRLHRGGALAPGSLRLGRGQRTAQARAAFLGLARALRRRHAAPQRAPAALRQCETSAGRIARHARPRPYGSIHPWERKPGLRRHGRALSARPKRSRTTRSPKRSPNASRARRSRGIHHARLDRGPRTLIERPRLAVARNADHLRQHSQ